MSRGVVVDSFIACPCVLFTLKWQAMSRRPCPLNWLHRVFTLNVECQILSALVGVFVPVAVLFGAREVALVLFCVGSKVDLTSEALVAVQALVFGCV